MDAPPSDICVPLDRAQFRSCGGALQHRRDATAFLMYDVTQPAAVAIHVKEAGRSRTWYTTRSNLQGALVYAKDFGGREGDGSMRTLESEVLGRVLRDPFGVDVLGVVFTLGLGDDHEHLAVGVSEVRGFLAGTFQAVSAHGEAPTDADFEEITKWLA